jgi:TonB family protein
MTVGKALAACVVAGAMLSPNAIAEAPPTIERPQWIERPTGDDFVRFYPVAALHQNVTGRAVLECAVDRNGRISCSVIEETPTGWGFGDAAVRISRAFRMSPQLADGTSVAGGRVRIPIRFMVSPGVLQFPETMPLEIRNLISAAAAEAPPVWEAAPSYEAVMAAYPPEARRRGVRGRGVLACAINSDRTLACTGERETPVGHGFLEAALRLAPSFRVAEREAGDPAPREPLILPINFGASRMETPVAQFYSGLGPLPMPEPAPAVVQALYPPHARESATEGEATVICTLGAPETRPACAIEHEAPVGFGFGEAVATWMLQFPFSVDDLGLIPGDQVSMTVSFRLTPPPR